MYIKKPKCNNNFNLRDLKVMLATWKKWPIETPERILSLVSSKFNFSNNV